MSALESSMALCLRHHGIEGWVREHEFATSIGRRWRFDFAWLDHMFSVEVEGLGNASGGASRHLSRHGFAVDAEKYEAAMLLGWTVYRVPGVWLMKGGRHVWRDEMIEAIRRMVG